MAILAFLKYDNDNDQDPREIIRFTFFFEWQFVIT